MIPFYEQKSDVFQIDTGNRMDFPPHLHLDVELLYVKRGRFAVQAGDEEYRMEEGELLLLIPNTIHAYRTLTAPEQTRYVLVIAQPACAGDYQNRLLTAHPVCPLVKGASLHPDVPYALDALVNGGEKQESQDVLRLFFQLILARIFPVMDWENQEHVLPHSLASQVICYISQHYRENVSLETLAVRFGVSRYHLSRLFSRTIRSGFYAYLHSLRVNYAKGQLQNTSQDILTIAMDSGFENQQTFNRVFKALCGMTPKEYRRAAWGIRKKEEPAAEKAHNPESR